jgi:hypothetical protein
MKAELELVLEALEKRFQRPFHPPDLRHLHTVADLAAAVIRGMRPCPDRNVTVDQFVRVRQALEQSAGVPRSWVRPRAALTVLLPHPRQHTWSRLTGALPGLPPLETPSWMDGAALWVSALAIFPGVMFPAVAGYFWLGTTTSILFVVAYVVVLGVIGAMIAKHSATELPEGMRTVGDVVLHLAPPQLVTEHSGARLLGEQRVLLEVRQIIATQAGIPLDHVSAECTLSKVCC